MHKIHYLLLLTLLVSSCVTNKDVVYLQGGSNQKKAALYPNQRPVYRVQPNDVLSVKIKTLDSKDAAYLNLETEGNVQQYTTAGIYLNSYSVDTSGHITLPAIGRLNVENMTLAEVHRTVQQQVDKLLNNATVLVHLVSFKISILGEVRSPGYYVVYNNQATLLEALALAGDLTSFGNSKTVTLIRQAASGAETIQLDLTDPAILQSPYYHLLPNDVIYVQPLEAKNKRQNIANLNFLSVLFTGISAVVLLLEFSKSN